MAAVPTDKDLEQKRAKNEKLREQIADAEAQATAAAAEQSRIIEGMQLDAETARLERQLQMAKEAAKKSVAQEGASAPLAAARAQLQAAQTETTVPGVAVDTNEGSKADNTAADNEKE